MLLSFFAFILTLVYIVEFSRGYVTWDAVFFWVLRQCVRSCILVFRDSPVSISNIVNIGRYNPLKQKLFGESTVILKSIKGS